MVKLKDRVRYHMLRSPLAPVLKAAQSLKHRDERAHRQRIASALSADEQTAALAEELNQQGFCHLDAILDRRLLDQMAQAALGKLALGERTLAQAPPGTSAKAFWNRLLDDELVDGRMPADSPHARFAVQPSLLSFLSRAMGSLPQLDYVLLTLSLPVDAPLAQSQLWHRDHDDTRTIKVFVYLTDVADEDDGPFTFIPGPVSDGVGFTLRSHLSDDQTFRHFPRSVAQSMMAPALSAFAVETSRCLHMGSRVAPGHRRLLYTATYTTFPKLDGTAPRGFILTGSESEIERAVLAPSAG